MDRITQKLDNIKDKKIIIAAVVGVLFLFSIIYYSHEVKKPQIHGGVKIEGIKVSGLTKKEAIKKVNEVKEEENKDKKVKFISGKKEYFIPYKDLGYTIETKEAVDTAYEIGRSENGFKNFFSILGVGIFHRNIQLNENFEENKVNLAIDNLQEKIYKRPKDAEISLKDDIVEIKKESNGKTLDIKKTKELINNYLLNTEDIILPVNTIKPNIYEKEFEGIDYLLADFSTKYSNSSSNRKENIALGASFFNDLLLKPEEEISFNNQAGGITAEQGFKTAGVIINGEYDNGVGGGICQVSTTLYNALIKADLDIIERSNHSRPIGYVPLGTDAAVVSGFKDLKFKNSFEHPIYIKSYADGDELRFRIFGSSKDKDYEVNIVPKLISTNQPREIKRYSTALPVGKTDVKSSGSKGFYYETFKEIIKDGEVIKTEKISNSNYISKDRVVVIGEGDPDAIRENKLAKEARQKEDKI